MDFLAGGFAEDQRWPPGFRFHPTDEELLVYYLKRKICGKRLKLDIIGETDVYKWDPEDLPAKSMLKSGERQWFFFSPRDRKYPNSSKSNRATRNGYWKATGKDRGITCNGRTVGTKKTLVFYRGRAPHGGRTDWVMHEYVMDEQELQRCQTLQDYYALYKVYKKSGAGPKNGEQYGAPFKEEEWIDDECSNVNNHAISYVQPHFDVACVDLPRIDSGILPPLNHAEEIANSIANEQLHPDGLAHAASQDLHGEESHGTAVGLSTGEAFFDNSFMALPPCSQQYGVQGGFEFGQSATSQLHFHHASGVPVAPNISGQQSYNIEDFLEVDDLFRLGSTAPNVEDLQPEAQDGLSEFDLFHDAKMFIDDMGPVNEELFGDSCLANLGTEVNNQFDYQLFQSNEAQQHSNPFYSNVQCGSEYTSALSPKGAISLPTTGVGLDGNSSKNSGGNGDGSVKEGTGVDNWVTSSIWSFVESIPTTPASAAEGSLVNLTFERLSSFRRVLKTNAASADVAVNKKRSSSSRKGLFYISVVGAMCAVFWVLMGETLMGVFGV